MSRRLRRAGSPWRILVHDYLGGTPGYGTAHNVTNQRNMGHSAFRLATRRFIEEQERRHEAAGISETIELPGTEFDELVIGQWIHLEQMDANQWWMNVGGVTVWITADRDGRPRNIQVYGPGDYADPAKGCTYDLKWTETDR